jgi:hypothetical protein
MPADDGVRLVLNLTVSFGLLAYAEFRNEILVPILIGRLDVVQQATTATNQFQQSTAGMMIFLVGLEVFRQVPNSFRQKSYLHVRRTGISVVSPELFYYFLLFCVRKWHPFLHFVQS